MSDEDVLAEACQRAADFTDGEKAFKRYIGALDSLRSQNQALQEAEAVALKRYGDIARDNGELRTQNQALQERAEKAEARLQLAEDALAMYQAGAVTHISIESRPTQETDPG